MKNRVFLRFTSLILYIVLLFIVAQSLSLSYFEVKIFYADTPSLIYYPLKFATDIFGVTDIVVRTVMIVVHLLSLLFFYQISKVYLDKERDRLWNMILFVLLPGVVSSAVIVHDTGLMLLLLLVYIFIYQRYEKLALALLPLYLFADSSFFILFTAVMIFYGLQKKWYVTLYALFLLSASIYIFGFIGRGGPENFLGQSISIIAFVFSPMLFFYFLYTIFRVGFKENKDLLWMISSVALILMLVLSVRQKVSLEALGPFFIILLPLMVKQFMHSYRIRIRVLRKGYRIIFSVAVLFLLVNSLSIYLNKVFYLFLDNPKEHFLYDHYIVKELSQELLQKNIKNIKVYDKKIQKRLRFYGVGYSDTSYVLRPLGCKNVTISYINRPVASFCVTKVNTKGKP